MNIYGYSDTDISGKVQNQTASPGLTNFTGDLKENGVDVITSADVGAYLPLAGGTMSGSIDMDINSLTDCSFISFPNNSVSIGVTATGANSIAVGSFSTVASASNTIALGTLNTSSAQYAVTIGNRCQATAARATSIGGGNLGIINPQLDSLAIGSDITLGTGINGIALGNGAGIGSVNDAIAIGTGSVNNTANSLLFGNTIVSNIRPNSTGTCDLGTTSARFKDLVMSGSISGATNTRTADNIVSNTGTSFSGNVVSFNGTSGKIITDTGIPSTSIVVGPVSSTSGNIATYSSTSGKVIADSGVLASSVVIGPVSSTSGRVAGFSNTTGKLIADTGVIAASIVTGPASSVNNQIPTYNGTTGKIIQADTTAIGTLGALTLANTTVSSSVSTGTLICPGGAGIAGKIFVGGNTIIGSAQTIALEQALTMRGTVNSANSPNMIGYVSTDQYPVIHHANSAHDNINIFFDCYFDWGSTTFRSSTSSGYYGIVKNTGRLNFQYGNTGVAGAAGLLNTAGYIDTTGTLLWQKPLKVTDATASSSISTGSIISAGGIGIAKDSYFGGTINTAGSITTPQLMMTNTNTSTGFGGNATLVAGSIFVGLANMAATDKVFVSRTTVNGSTALGTLVISSFAAFVGFTVTSVNMTAPGTTITTDVSSFTWVLIRMT